MAFFVQHLSWTPLERLTHDQRRNLDNILLSHYKVALQIFGGKRFCNKSHYKVALQIFGGKRFCNNSDWIE